MTELHWAAFKGDFKEVLRLLKDGADINALTKMGHTALDFAVEHKTLEILLRHGARHGIVPVDTMGLRIERVELHNDVSGGVRPYSNNSSDPR